MKLGILVHFDPTVKKINSELLFLDKLLGWINPDQVKLIKCMGRAESLFRRFDFNFKYDVVDPQELLDYDLIIAWNSTNLANFFGGTVSETFVNYYTFVSHFTNRGTPILYRSGDSENEITDYRDAVLKRSKNDPEFTVRNLARVTVLESTPRINYDNFYLIVNGERDKFDWVSDTYLKRKPMPHFTPKICEQALYLGDDLFFQVLERYAELSRLVHVSHHESLYWIGFIEHRNAGRKKVFTELFKDLDPTELQVILQTNTELIIPGVTCVNQGIVGDTDEYFEHLSQYLGYVFIGKGTKTCAYVNKTIYDCFIARLPVLVYADTDQERMIFPDLPEFYFSTLTELKAFYEQLKVPAYRAMTVQKQAQALKRRLQAAPDRQRLTRLLEKMPQESRSCLLEF